MEPVSKRFRAGRLLFPQLVKCLFDSSCRQALLFDCFHMLGKSSWGDGC